MNALTGRDDITLLDIADRLLDTGVRLNGEATISVADVDLIYLGLDLALTSVDRAREGYRAVVRAPSEPASDRSARYVPSGPGAMDARLQPGVLPERVDVDPNDVERSLAKLVLTIVDFIRQLLERQAVRRMEAGTLTDAEVERVGVALERLETKLYEMADAFGLKREDLTLRLGPLGELA